LFLSEPETAKAAEERGPPSPLVRVPSHLVVFAVGAPAEVVVVPALGVLSALVRLFARALMAALAVLSPFERLIVMSRSGHQWRCRADCRSAGRAQARERACDHDAGQQ
jgi:hypothetical protein